MDKPSWLVDSNRIATKIRSASSSCEPGRVNWKSNPTKACPNCQHIVDNSDVTQEWPGLPRGVKFDPSDQEIIWHLLAKSGISKLKPHPFIDEFIPTVDEEGGICYTHPQNLPGVKQDGSVSHFFHRAIKAYNTGTRKRRKINGVDLGDVRWHKTGRTKPVILDGVQRGCKKIMVLYASLLRGGKAEKTNWVMHQYHLGTEEDEKDGEYVISKIFYQQQQQQIKQTEGIDEDLIQAVDSEIVKVDPVTPMSAPPVPPRAEKRISDFDPGLLNNITCVDQPVPVCDIVSAEDEDIDAIKNTVDEDNLKAEIQGEQMGLNNDSQNGEDLKCLDSMSQYWLDSQQLKECLNLCDDLFQSQSPNRDGSENNKELSSKTHLSEYYANLGADDLKKDLQECQDLVLDPANIETDTPDDFRLSQLDFGSQSSFLDWGGSKEVK